MTVLHAELLQRLQPVVAVRRPVAVLVADGDDRIEEEADLLDARAISRLTWASDGSRWYGVGSTLVDRQRDEQQRIAAERIVVPPEDGAALVLDLRRELIERAGRRRASSRPA